MNVFFAGLGAETNSFSSIPSAEAAFARGQRRGETVFASRGMYGEMARALRDIVAAEGGVVGYLDRYVDRLRDNERASPSAPASP